MDSFHINLDFITFILRDLLNDSLNIIEDKRLILKIDLFSDKYPYVSLEFIEDQLIIELHSF